MNFKKFLRWTNISRLIGILLLVFGKFFPSGMILQAGEYSVSGVNSWEISGIALIFAPMIIEFIRRKKQNE